MIERETVPPSHMSEEIHHSIADADDIEEVWDPVITVADVFRNLLHHPLQLLTRWNWKAVVLAMMVRGAFYFTIYKVSRESWLVTLTAVTVELFFRFFTTGIAGALVQSFRKATPVWLANVIVSIMLPAFSHTVEFITHYAQERYFFDVFAASQDGVARRRAFAISVLFSVVSVLFNLYAMRNGALLVGAGEDTQSLKDDFKQMPRLVGEFTIALPVLISRFLENGRVLNAIGVFFTFGFTVGAILGTFRGKWEWAWRSALGAWAILLFALVLAFVVRRIFGHDKLVKEA
jgi:hypothetical protein